jgi:hypothetical protein
MYAGGGDEKKGFSEDSSWGGCRDEPSPAEEPLVPEKYSWLIARAMRGAWKYVDLSVDEMGRNKHRRSRINDGHNVTDG